VRKRMIVVSTLAVLTLSVSGTAHAQPSDLRTYFTFNAPVTLPGVTLPAGRYLFRLANPQGGRRVINVLSADGKTSLAMLHTIPNQLPKAPEKPEIRFMETAASLPPAIKTWWYAGRSTGYEFIYPRQQALQLAKATSERVLTTRTETKELETADLSRISGSGVPAPVTVEENPAPVAPTGRVQQGEVAQAEPIQESQGTRQAQVASSGSSPTGGATPDVRADEAARSTTRTRLPRTASSIPMMALLGALMMMLGIGLSRPARVRV